jgi:hypothetical protein
VIPQNDAVDMAFDRAGVPGQGEPGGDGVLVAAQPGDKGAQFGLAAGGGVGHPFLQVTVAAPLDYQCGEGCHVRVKGGEFGAGAEDGGELAVVVSGKAAGVRHDPSGHFPDLWRLWSRDGHGGGGAQRGQVVADAGVATAVSAGADLPPQPGGVGASLVPPLVQVGGVFLNHAGPSAGAVMDQQFLRAGGAGEPGGRCCAPGPAWRRSRGRCCPQPAVGGWRHAAGGSARQCGRCAAWPDLGQVARCDQPCPSAARHP